MRKLLAFGLLIASMGAVAVPSAMAFDRKVVIVTSHRRHYYHHPVRRTVVIEHR